VVRDLEAILLHMEEVLGGVSNSGRDVSRIACNIGSGSLSVHLKVEHRIATYKFSNGSNSLSCSHSLSSSHNVVAINLSIIDHKSTVGLDNHTANILIKGVRVYHTSSFSSYNGSTSGSVNVNSRVVSASSRSGAKEFSGAATEIGCNRRCR